MNAQDRYSMAAKAATAKEADFKALLERPEVKLLLGMVGQPGAPADLNTTLMRVAFEAGGESAIDVLVREMLASIDPALIGAIMADKTIKKAAGGVGAPAGPGTAPASN